MDTMHEKDKYTQHLVKLTEQTGRKNEFKKERCNIKSHRYCTDVLYKRQTQFDNPAGAQTQIKGNSTHTDNY